MEGIKSGIEALGGIEALLLPASDLLSGLWELVSLSYSSMGSVRELLQELHQA